MTTSPIEVVDVSDDWAELRGRLHTIMWTNKVRQGAAAKAVGVSQSNFGRKLTGEITMSVPELLRLAKYLGAEVSFGPDGLVVRHVGLEPTTRWYAAFARSSARRPRRHGLSLVSGGDWKGEDRAAAIRPVLVPTVAPLTLVRVS